jgi:putative oxidoreductase
MKTTSYIQRRSPRWRDLPIDLISGDLISGSPIARWAPIPLRLIVGYGFMEHGVAKLARGLDAFPAILQALGVPAPHFIVPGNSAGTWRARTAFHGMAHDLG